MIERSATRDAAEGRDLSAGARFELRISVGYGAEEEDVVVNASEADLVGDLVTAVAQRMNGYRNECVWSERQKRLLDERLPLDRAGIRWGDRLILAASPSEPTRVGGAPTVELMVTGGPCAGQRWSLGEGTYLVGRDPTSDIFIDDRSLSREHASVDIRGGAVTVTDLDSSNGVAIDGQALRPRSPHELRARDELELGRTLVRFSSLMVDSTHDLVERRGRIEFNRPPRVNATVEPFKRELMEPPTRARKARLPLAAAVVPFVMGIAMFAVLGSPFMLVICALSPMMAVSTYLTDRRGGKTSFSRGSAEFRADLEAATRELDKALEEEVTQRRQEAPDMATLFERIETVSHDVWERRPGDRDFLSLRLGVDDLPARARVMIPCKGEAALRASAEETLASRRNVPSVPLVVDLRVAGTVGLVGPRFVTEGVARALLLQAASLHSPGELAIAAAVGEENVADWTWLKWLPHFDVERVGLQFAWAQGTAESEDLPVDGRDLVADRKSQAKVADATRRTTLLLLVDEDAGVNRALVSASLADAAANGVIAVWLGRTGRNLPGQTGSIVEAEDSRSQVMVTDVASGQKVADVSADGVDRDTAERVARALSPIKDISELARAGDIPPRVSLLELLQLSLADSTDLRRRWEGWRGRLDTTIGVGVDGPFTVDLLRDGPHALIAGTTGSGKSELLRTFVAAASATAPPNRLVFLLVDYKGGSAFAPCAALPHVVDVVSDLDEHLAERALVSLEAELKRRERILADYGAKDLNELQRRAREHAPPLLVIAVDEFAKLRDEVPEFVDGVVDIAQRGRSLGVHMVLAAQTLRNAFTPAIRANTNLRIALRVSDDGESEDVIASPLAARIPSGERYRGRGFARTGHSELHEFQAAYVSGRSMEPEHRELELASFTVSARGSAAASGNGKLDSDDDNDLTALGAVAHDVLRDMRIELPSPPWLAPLPPLLSLDSLPATSGAPGCAVVGLIDLPHLQRQDPLVIDLPAVGNVAVFGAGGSGKTTLLTTTALSLAQRHTSDELRIYGLDAGSGGLAVVEELPHCGGVIRVEDEERVDRLFRELLRQIETRSSGRAQDSAPTVARRTVLLLDDLGAFVHLHEKPGAGAAYEQLQRVVAGGRPARVHVVFTASRRGAVSSLLAAHIGQRLVLRMPSHEDLISLGLDAKRVRGAQLPPGRGFTTDSSEFQVAVPTNEDGELDVSDAAQALGPANRDATRVVTLPSTVPRASLGPARSPEQIPIGLADNNLVPAHVDLSDTHFLVVGSYRSGRSTALKTLALGLSALAPTPRLWLLAPRRSPLRELDLWEQVATATDSCAQLITTLADESQTEEPGAPPVFLFIDDGGELADPLLSAKLERIVRAGRDGGVTVIAGVETSSARGIAIPWIREIRKDGHGLLLQPDLLTDGDLLGARLPRRVALPMGPGRGFVVARGVAELVQLAS